MSRWPLIRHARYLWHSWRMNRWYAMWASVGFYGPAESDLHALDQIWRGER